MNIWVVAANGMLGSALLNFCHRQGLRAVGTARQEADLTHLPQLINQSEKIQPTHIVNCAAFTDVDGAEKDPYAAHAVNVEGAANLAKVAKHCKARLVHISTDYVFDGKKMTPYVEDDRCKPINAYGLSKWEGERRVLEIFPQACILRTSWLFGQRGKNFISSILTWLQQKEELRVVMDQFGRPTYCQDLAEAIITLLDAEGIIHFANQGEKSRYQIAVDIMALAKAKGHVLKCQRIIPVSSSHFPTVAQRPMRTVLDTGKYTYMTNREPRPWDEVLNEFLDDKRST
jgi:dTDP-4-dehydrorhamnose reductase